AVAQHHDQGRQRLRHGRQKYCSRTLRRCLPAAPRRWPPSAQRRGTASGLRDHRLIGQHPWHGLGSSFYRWLSRFTPASSAPSGCRCALIGDVMARAEAADRRSPTVTTPDTLPAEVARDISEFTLEVPSWGYGNSGTRFKVFGTPGTPRDPFEKLTDAAQTHAYTCSSPRVSLHYPWDKVDDFGELRRYADDLGLQLWMINSNTCQEDEYKFGSLTAGDKTVRRRAIDHHLECIDVMRATGSKELKIWLADGTNYAGQDSIRARQDRLAESLAEIY